jgi:hypothetical protein
VHFASWLLNPLTGTDGTWSSLTVGASESKIDKLIVDISTFTTELSGKCQLRCYPYMVVIWIIGNKVQILVLQFERYICFQLSTLLKFF